MRNVILAFVKTRLWQQITMLRCGSYDTKPQVLWSTFNNESSDTNFMSYKPHLNIVIYGQSIVLMKANMTSFKEQREYICNWIILLTRCQ